MEGNREVGDGSFGRNMVGQERVGEDEGENTKGICMGNARGEKGKQEGKMGGMLMGIKRELWKKGEKIEVSTEGIIVGRIREGRKSWRIVGVYVKDNIGEMLQELERWVGEKERQETMETIIGGDFNARTGE